jgi:multiple sugar transport system permease protein
LFVENLRNPRLWWPDDPRQYQVVTRLILQMLLALQIVATMQMFVEAFILTNGGSGATTISVVNLIYQYAFALSGASNYNSASALGVVLMLVLAVFSGGYLWLTRQTDR